MNFAVQADHKVKLKENEKRDKYLDLARELENLRNKKVTLIPIVIGALGRLEELEIGGQIETIQTTALLSSVRILKRVPET